MEFAVKVVGSESVTVELEEKRWWVRNMGEMKRKAKTVIALTEELLATTKQNAISRSDFGTSTSESLSLPQSKGNGMEPESISFDHEKFAMGTNVQDVYSEDGEWFVDPTNVRPLEFNDLLEADKVAEDTKKAIKRNTEQAIAIDFQSRSLPIKLNIILENLEDVLLVVTGLLVA
ncbi:hypothetical protein Ddye_009306 [Dipteronia dyeriana]|uniref:Uncharacterized protein n=1 Tax=Dipteronia dyeriana TaxID=168575 RepID=A0AAD9XB59_9ROSI|nr:hypothetical protein Ddye_009306 [Dipteronia dyeriana]